MPTLEDKKKAGRVHGIFEVIDLYLKKESDQKVFEKVGPILAGLILNELPTTVSKFMYSDEHPEIFSERKIGIETWMKEETLNWTNAIINSETNSEIKVV